ncbi:MAG: hypothetical protein ABI780_14500 [Ardenticatenales bacterium]
MLLPDRDRPYVNWTSVCPLYEDRIWMCLDGDMLSAVDAAILSAEPGWEWGGAAGSTRRQPTMIVR